MVPPYRWMRHAPARDSAPARRAAGRCTCSAIRGRRPVRRAVLHGVKDRMGERVGDTARRPASRYLGASGGHCGASFWEGESDPPTRPGQIGEGAARAGGRRVDPLLRPESLQCDAAEPGRTLRRARPRRPRSHERDDGARALLSKRGVPVVALSTPTASESRLRVMARSTIVGLDVSPPVTVTSERPP